MSANTIESLLEWMKTADPMMGWDCIAALSRDKANRILQQEYVARFDTASYLPPISGVVDETRTSSRQYLHDFRLDVPRLSFENADVENSAARLTMSVVGGTQLSMEHVLDAWYVSRVSEIDPLQGPQLHLDLKLDRVPGIVDEEGRVMLDLKDSDNFSLTYADTEYGRSLGGDFFRQLFNTLPDEQRIFTLGAIQRGDSSVLRPQSFKLRTQQNPAQAADGAILILIRMAGGSEGDVPGTDYRYLIPDDEQEAFSATVMLPKDHVWKQLDLGVDLLACLRSLVPLANFELTHTDGKLTGAVATSGQMWFSGTEISLQPIQFDDFWIKVDGAATDLELPADGSSPLTLSVQDGRPSVTWATSGYKYVSTFIYVVGSNEERPLYQRTDYSVSLSARYDLKGEAGDIKCAPVDWKLDVTSQVTDLESPSAEHPGAFEFWDDPAWAIKLLWITAEIARLTWLDIEEQIQAELERSLQVSNSITPFIDESIKLNFGHAIEVDQFQLPNDVVAFGRINPKRSQFGISPLQPLVLAGTTQQFSVQPAVDKLQWSVQSLEGDTASPGTIDANGLYRAPPAIAFEGRFLRVRVQATEVASGYHSVALVTVLANRLTVNPLIVVCEAGGHVELNAGQWGIAPLQWSIRNPGPQSGRLQPSERPDGDHAYWAADKAQPGQTYVLDEVEVRNSLTGVNRIIYVLARLGLPGLLVSIVEDGPAPGAAVQLQATAQGQVAENVMWQVVPPGAGSISPEGLFTPENDASVRFALIFAKVEIFGFVLEGHIILPLPLTRYPDEVQRLRKAPARRISGEDVD
ncbi:hypothetical protein RRX38_06180 [Pseudomonas sp. DTU_2021_1001937_2_SI_NGA_ILE_001]|uniref:hypothetical protein n=1 Tax=Pseudomonas sp. DTU_2021_1001937_2_SI_NGA_ILE_001 TaxID=3077589 RepID=UPI0028FC160F|nr:hypothetical protein [Pseudomonas sp. DTU_2021_1001937_2_SI_NGA_ILE_001]WNW10759.1 hypothetical protein RRX38_06180 [Pseudomonas sp. DTU_2021_1001937_2_SI_NGA_ILE_001]